MKQQELIIQTQGRTLQNITADINKKVASSNISTGLCHIFNKHTSASLILSENSDVQVCEDLENFMQGLAPDELNLYKHNYEGADDMPAHIRTVLTQSDLTIPITNGQLNLGTWQGVFLWEHRYQPHSRVIVLTTYGSE